MSAVCALSLILSQALMVPTDRPPVTLKIGDVVSVRVVAVEGYDGEYRVLTDGTIVGLGFGRIQAEGRTVAQLQTEITTRLTAILRRPVVEVVLKDQQQELVFISGLTADKSGSVVLTPGLVLRALVATAAVAMQSDEMDVILFRDGKEIVRLDLNTVLAGSDERASLPLRANDVVTLAQTERMRVWVLGSVVTPGERMVRPGSDVYQAVALAGGTNEAAQSDADAILRLRRGPEVMEFSLRPDAGSERPQLQAGDVLEVVLSSPVRVTVGGEVVNGGAISLRRGQSLVDALESAGGPTERGLLSDVLVVRRGEMFRVDVTATVRPGEEFPTFGIEDGDTVIVRRNERYVTVLGRLARPGEQLLESGKEYRLADVIARAGGEILDGTLTRVFVGQRAEDGRVVVREYRLDKFLKDGDLSQNPKVDAGDVVYLGSTKGITLSGVTQALSGALILTNIFRN